MDKRTKEVIKKLEEWTEFLLQQEREKCAKIIDKKVKFLTEQFKKGYISYSINPTLRELAKEIREMK